MNKRLITMLLCVVLVVGLIPTTTSANGTGKFTVTYKTNAGVVMGTIEYTVGDVNNALPLKSEISSLFGEFIAKAAQGGSVAVPNQMWYSDAEFTQAATFPAGSEGENYTVYCKFTTGIIINQAYNMAEDKSYSNVEDVVPPFIAVDWGASNARNDQQDNTIIVFEKETGGQWIEVDESHYTDHMGNTWGNQIYFSNVSDSGIYRIKYACYTAKDSSGNVLWYDFAYDSNDGTYEVEIAPVELTITGVQATDRSCDGTDKVSLTGGSLSGVLYGDDVSFDLGTGILDDTMPGQNKPVTTNIQLTGNGAGNYILKQPTDIQATITHDPVKVDRKEATCTEDGNNEYWYCKCGKYFGDESGTAELALEEVIIEANGHGETEIQRAKKATCTAEGYTGDEVCKDCGEVVVTGKAIAKTAHTYKDGKCLVCGATDPSKPTEPSKPADTSEPTETTAPDAKPDENIDSPQTGDQRSITLYFAMMLAAGMGLTGTAVYGRKKKLKR